jgi:peptide-methionine (R)-S-oxide reductase
MQVVAIISMLLAPVVESFAPTVSVIKRPLLPLTCASATKSNDEVVVVPNVRRDVLHLSSSAATIISSLVVSTGIVASSPKPASAGGNSKSRTVGYEVQHTEAEWSSLLTPTQYFILRQGGTESPYSSILEGEERRGIYACAGCGTPLFDATQKFHSGTGWPSFANIVNDNVEMEDVSRIQYQLAGAEVRCKTCGGHLGDVFADGFLFPGTPAIITGKRYCIDGAALAFVPKDGRGEIDIVMGDSPPPKGARGPMFPG